MRKYRGAALRHSWLASLAVALLLCWGAADAAGPYRPFQAGLWSGGAYTDDRSGTFSHCSAGVVYDSGTNLFVVSTETHGWWLGFTNPQWALTPGTAVPVTLHFDDRSSVELSGTAADAQLLLVALPDDPRLLETFRRSGKLSLTAQQRSFSLQLGGAAKVISELTACVHNSLALEGRGPAEPRAPERAVSRAAETAAPPPLASSRAPEIPNLGVQGSPELEEIGLAKKFLAAAGRTDAHLIDADKPPALASFKAVWKSEDTAGAVKIIPPGPEVTGLRIASELISVDPVLCKGNFSAARSSEVIDGNTVFSAALSCVDARSERITQFFIAPRQRGGFAVFAVIADYAGRGSAAGRENAGVLAKAAIQAVAPETPGG